MTDYVQTDVTTTHLACLSNGTQFYIISAGAAAGTVSHSVSITSAGGANKNNIYHGTTLGQAGTATWIGASVIRLNVTTANSNISWQGISACSYCSDLSRTPVTVTSALGISLGTTGVKTASIESTAAFTFPCDTATAAFGFSLAFSNAATMAAVFNFLNDQVDTLPFTASAAPAPSAIFTLAQLGAGQ